MYVENKPGAEATLADIVDKNVAQGLTRLAEIMEQRLAERIGATGNLAKDIGLEEAEELLKDIRAASK